MSNNKKLRTRTRYRIVGSDYSAQEPRMSCFLSSDPKMLEAYTHGKDLYAMIASSALGVKYDECLEFWPEFCSVEIDGKEVKNIVNGRIKTGRKNDEIFKKEIEREERERLEKEHKSKYKLTSQSISSILYGVD